MPLSSTAKYFRRSPSEIKKLLKAQSDSSFSMIKFCKSRRIVLGTFQSWKKKYLNKPKTPEFVKIDQSLAQVFPIDSNIEITTPNGFSVKLGQNRNFEILNELLQIIVNQVQIISVNEITPSMNDIFIQKVQEVMPETLEEEVGVE